MGGTAIKITIVTSVFNGAGGLLKTAESIRCQEYPSLQWIVIDGASTDGTLQVIESNADIVSKSVSEPDSGIYDAWNKAVPFIEGDWAIFLGAGDTLRNPQSLTAAVAILGRLDDDIALAYGNVTVTSVDGKELFAHREKDLQGWENCRPVLPCHQGVFQRKFLFSGQCFDPSYRIAADTKFLLQAMQKYKIAYLPVDVSCMELMGISTDPGNVFLVLDELHRLTVELQIKVPYFHEKWFRAKSHIKRFLLKSPCSWTFRYVANFYRNLTGKESIY